MQYRHEVLAGGSMYAVKLPQILPAAGEPGGPPLPADYRYIMGNPTRAALATQRPVCGAGSVKREDH
jgi:hypothetical protein